MASLGQLSELNRRQTFMFGAGLLAAASMPAEALSLSPQQGELSGGLDLLAAPLPFKLHRIQQKSTRRYVDARSTGDFEMITNGVRRDSQLWLFRRVGEVYSIRQQSSGLYMDGLVGGDFGMIARGPQPSLRMDRQRWVAIKMSDQYWTLQQLATNRFADAYANSNDYRMVTRLKKDNNNQRWALLSAGNGAFLIQQKSTGRFMEAYNTGEREGFRIVTRPPSNKPAQRWNLKNIGYLYTIQQASTGRLMDAYANSNGQQMVTRPAKNNEQQRWVTFRAADGSYTLQQLWTTRFVDAYGPSRGLRMFTSYPLAHDGQRWIISAA